MKRTLAILLALVMAVTMFAACQTEKPVETQPKETQGTNKPAETKPAETEPAEEGPLFAEPITFEVVGRDKDTNDAAMLARIKEYTNVDLNWRRMDSFDEQYALLVSDNKIPDISIISGNYFANEYGPQGAYVNVYEYLDIMPNLAKLMEEYPAVKKSYQLNDNEMYRIPYFKINGANSYAGWIYRKDVFDKLDLKWPTNREEFETVLRALKAAYPNSYPLAVPSLVNTHMTNIVDTSHWFGTGLTFPGRNNAYCDYNHATETWYQGATSPEMKEMLQWYKSMIDEGLMFPSLAASGNDMLAQLYTDNVFVYFAKLSSVPTYNSTGRATNPDFTCIMGSPFAIGSKGVAAGRSVGQTGSYNFAVSTACHDVEAALKFIDWFYSEEGIRVTNMGTEGVEYTLDASGNVVWNADALAAGNPQSAQGLAISCLCPVIDNTAYLTWQDEAFNESFAAVEPYATVSSTPSIKQYNEEQQAIVDTYGASYTSFVKGELTKFLLGERDFAEWDAFVKEADETYHGAELTKCAQDAWDAQNAG